MYSNSKSSSSSSRRSLLLLQEQQDMLLPASHNSFTKAGCDAQYQHNAAKPPPRHTAQTAGWLTVQHSVAQKEDDLVQGWAVVWQHSGVRPRARSETGGTVSTGRSRSVAGELVRRGALLPLGILSTAVG